MNNNDKIVRTNNIIVNILLVIFASGIFMVAGIFLVSTLQLTAIGFMSGDLMTAFAFIYYSLVKLLDVVFGDFVNTIIFLVGCLYIIFGKIIPRKKYKSGELEDYKSIMYIFFGGCICFSIVCFIILNFSTVMIAFGFMNFIFGIIGIVNTRRVVIEQKVISE